MKTIITLIACFLLASCGEDDKATTPPFNDFWHSTRFDYKVGESKYSNLQYYNIHAKLKGSSGNAYQYANISEPGTMPEGTTLKLTFSNSSLTLNSFGQLTRIGDVVPSDYTGDHSAWNAESFTYEIIVEIDTGSKAVKKGSIKINSATFNASQDISGLINLTPINNGETWSIGKTTGAEIIGGADIRFTLDIQ